MGCFWREIEGFFVALKIKEKLWPCNFPFFSIILVITAFKRTVLGNILVAGILGGLGVVLFM